MSDTYIDIMLQSLKKKVQVLDEIIRLDDVQKSLLEKPEATVEEFDKTVEDKSALITQMEQLDSGFEKLYERMNESLQQDKDKYADEIRAMQDLIRRITDQSVQIQAQEVRNKDLMTQKFLRVKKQVVDVRANSKATTQYYQSMMRGGYYDPQFMDNKK